MIINLTLGAVRYVQHHEIITLPEEEVKLSFSSSDYAVGRLIVSARNGAEERQYRTEGAAVDITELCKRVGRVDITASLEIRGEVVKVWQIEPFIIKEIPGGFEAIPEIEDLRSRLSTAEKAIAELAEITT